ncbi:MAG: type II CAAX endopeptidase family protein [Mariniphaga sp.]
MKSLKKKYYPTIIQAVHLLILYLFVQTVVDFPLALIDYYTDSEYLYHPIKKIVLNTGSTLFILIYGFIKTKAPLKEVFPLRFFNPLVLLPLITFFWGAHNILDVVNAGIERILPAPAWFWELFGRIFKSDYGWWGAFIRVAVVAPIVEELIFRGLIFSGLKKNYNAWTTVVVSALLFSLFHLNPWQMPGTFVLGLILGWIMLRTSNILLSIIGHSLNNAMVLLTVTYWQKINTHAFYIMEVNDRLRLSFLIILLSIILIWLATIRFSRRLKNKI